MECYQFVKHVLIYISYLVIEAFVYQLVQFLESENKSISQRVADATHTRFVSETRGESFHRVLDLLECFVRCVRCSLFEQPSDPFKYACSSFHSHQRDAREEPTWLKEIFYSWKYVFAWPSCHGEHAYTRIK